MAPETELTSYQAIIDDARKNRGEWVLIERDGPVATVRMNDRESLNALSAPLTVQLLDSLNEVIAEPAIRAVVLTGTDPGFCAGGDQRAIQQVAHPLIDQSEAGVTALWRWIRYQFSGLARAIIRTDKTFIAAVNGPCAGVGMGTALACDLILASERAKFTVAFGRIGLITAVGTSHFLTHRVGYHRAFDLYTSGRILSGQDAYDMGMVNEVLPHERLLPRAYERCEQILSLPEHSVAMIKPLLRSAHDIPWEHSLVAEEFAEPMCFTTRAHRDAVSAFLSRRSGASDGR